MADEYPIPTWTGYGEDGRQPNPRLRKNEAAEPQTEAGRALVRIASAQSLHLGHLPEPLSAIVARIEREAATRAAGIDAEIAAAYFHDRREDWTICTHRNQHLAGKDCGRDALNFIAEYARLAGEKE